MNGAAGLIVVFDVGKTNAKLTAFERAGEGPVAVEALSTPSRVLDGPPYPHIDVDALWAFLLDGLAQLAQHGRIRDVVTTTHGCAWALVGDDPHGADGGIVLPVMDYEWEGVRAHDAAYDAIRPPFAQTGSPPLPVGLNFARQLHYLARDHGDAFARARHVLPFPQYWTWRLSGVPCADVSSLGCHSDLWRPREGMPSGLVDALGIADRLGPVRPAGEAAGHPLPGIIEATGLPADARVRVGIHDSNASLVPHLDGSEPFALVSSGTWAIAFAVNGEPVELDETRDTLLNVDARGRAVPSARFMAGRERALVMGAADPCPVGLDVARRVIGEGAMLLPAFVPGSGPFPNATPAGTDDPRLADPAARSAASSLYTGMMVATLLRLIGARGPTLIDGNLARDAIACAMIGAVTRRPVRAVSGGTSEGAAHLALDPAPVRHAAGEPAAAIPETERESWRAYHVRWLARAGA